MRTTEAVDTIGCTFRQLDYLTRLGIIKGQGTGSGNARSWPEQLVARIALAYHIAQAIPTERGRGVFPQMAQLVVDSPAPPRRGYAVVAVDPLWLIWAPSWADVRRSVDGLGAAVVVSFDLDDLVGTRIDVDQLVPA